MESNVTRITGDEFVNAVTVSTKGEERVISTDALFVAVGIKPSTDLVKDVIELDEYGFIITDETMKTNVGGVFAAGDIRKKPLRQVITAVSDGAVAGEEAAKYVNAHKNAL